MRSEVIHKFIGEFIVGYFRVELWSADEIGILVEPLVAYSQDGKD